MESRYIVILFIAVFSYHNVAMSGVNSSLLTDSASSTTTYHQGEHLSDYSFTVVVPDCHPMQCMCQLGTCDTLQTALLSFPVVLSQCLSVEPVKVHPVQQINKLLRPPMTQLTYGEHCFDGLSFSERMSIVTI
jgi:hypothetical protein